MTAEAFKAALAKLDLTQSGFARRMRELGDPRSLATILRTVSAYSSGTHKVPGEMHVILRLLGVTG